MMKKWKPSAFRLHSVGRQRLWRDSGARPGHQLPRTVQTGLSLERCQNVGSFACCPAGHVSIAFLRHVIFGHQKATPWTWEVQILVVVPKRNKCTHFLSWAPYILPCENDVYVLGTLHMLVNARHSELKNYQGVSLPKSGTTDTKRRPYYLFYCKLQTYLNIL